MPAAPLAPNPNPRYRRSVRLTLLWNRRSYILKATLCAAASATLVAFLSPVRFTAAARLMPPNMPSAKEFAFLDLIESATGAGFTGQSELDEQFLAMAQRGGLFVGILSSRTVQDGIIQKFQLRDGYGVATQRDARKQLSRRTQILLDRKSDILTIEVTDHDPQRAVAIVQEYIAQLDRVIIDRDSSSAHSERAFLEQRLQEIRDELETSENKLAQFSRDNAAIDLDEQTKANIKVVASLEGQLATEQTELQALRQSYAGNNIRVQAQQSQINELRRALRKLEGRPDSPALVGFSPSNLQLDLSLRKLPLLAKPYAALYRRVQMDEALFQALTQKYELARIEEARATPSVKVLDNPEFPEKKAFPQRLLMIAVGFCLGLVVSIIWTFLRADWEHLHQQDPGKLLASEIHRAIRDGLIPSRG